MRELVSAAQALIDASDGWVNKEVDELQDAIDAYLALGDASSPTPTSSDGEFVDGDFASLDKEDSQASEAGSASSPSAPIRSAIDELIAIYAKKAKDYAHDGDPFSNFKDVAVGMNTTPVAVAESLMRVKLSRLTALRANNREPQNEAVVDSYRDLMVYAVIAYALVAP